MIVRERRPDIGTEPVGPDRVSRSEGLDLAARGVAAHHRAQRAGPLSYPGRHRDWSSWCRRQRGLALLATTLAVPADAITAGDDPDRHYGPGRGQPGDLYTVTDPHTGWSWRFIPDPLAEHAWLLLGDCTHCTASAVPVAHIAGLADIGAYHTHHTTGQHRERRAGDEAAPAIPPLPLLAHGDPSHRPGCRLPHPASRSATPTPRTPQ